MEDIHNGTSFRFRKDEIPSLATKWKDQKNMASEISQTQEDRCHIISLSYMWNL
jgi:hypothetical protein